PCEAQLRRERGSRDRRWEDNFKVGKRLQSEPVDESLREQRDQLQQLATEKSELLQRLREDVPAFIQQTVKELYAQPEPTNDVELPPTALHGMPSKQEMERLNKVRAIWLATIDLSLLQMHEEIASEVSNLARVVPQRLAETRQLREYLEVPRGCSYPLLLS